MRRFELTKEHVALLRRANVGWNHGECGAAGLDAKRPYGNGDVVADVAELTGDLARPDEDGEFDTDDVDRLMRLHRQTEGALSVVLRAGTFEPGTYEADDYTDNWRRVESGKAVMA